MDRAADYIDSQQRTIDALVAALRQSVKWLEMVAEPSASGMAYYPQFSADLKIARAALAAVDKE